MTLSMMSVRVKPLRITSLIIMTHDIKTLRMMSLSIKALSIIFSTDLDQFQSFAFTKHYLPS